MSLLDTPGHKDFSEDTYRALIAADSVVMVIDAANGVEAQTRKLFEVCRRHRLPILTFVNKFDRPARDPLELLDEIERTLGIAAAPVNWPIGNAEQFRGVYDIQRADAAALRARGAGAVSRAGGHRRRSTIPTRGELIGDGRLRAVPSSRSTSIRAAGTQLRRRGISGRPADAGVLRQRADQLRPRAVPPARSSSSRRRRSRAPSDSGVVSPTDERFTGFVFKIQANMDPRHRDRVAFVRVCSGRFTQGHGACPTAGSASRSARRAPTASSAAIARRSTRPTPATSSAWSIPGQFAIGDTLYTGAPLRFPERPALPGRALRPRAPAGHPLQAVRRGLQAARGRRADAGVLRRRSGRREPIVGVVGALQFDVIASRLRTEYGVEVADRRRQRTPRRAGWPIPHRPIPSLGGQTRAVAVDRREPPRAAVRVGVGACSTSSASIPPSPCSPNPRSLVPPPADKPPSPGTPHPPRFIDTP